MVLSCSGMRPSGKRVAGMLDEPARRPSFSAKCTAANVRRSTAYDLDHPPRCGHHQGGTGAGPVELILVFIVRAAAAPCRSVPANAHVRATSAHRKRPD